MNEGMRNFIVGITSIVALLGLAVLLFNFGELDRFFHPRYEIKLITSNASGLRPGSGVDFNGVPVGVVESVVVEPNPVNPVRIVLSIEKDAQIPQRVDVSAAHPLIGGGARLQLTATPTPDGSVGPLFLRDGSAELTASIGGGMIEEMTAALDRRLEPLTKAVESFSSLSQTYVNLGQRLNEMIQPQTKESIAAGTDPNVHTAVIRLNNALDDLREGVDMARQWLGDEQLRTDTKAAVAGATELMERISGAVERYTSLADSLQTNSDDLAKRLMPVVDALAVTLEDVRRLTKLASEGHGTMAQLLNNPDLYNSMNDAAVRLERALTEAQLLIEKFKAEGVPVRF
jgi:phospholipid/cholesterol/gamma-HCH transport system substrate-binding protein